MIVVAVASTVRIRDFTQTDWPTAWVGGGGAGNFKRFLSTALPWVDRTYRTDGFRALSGHSAGGQFVLYCLTAEPALFQAYIALSPEPRLGRQPAAAFARGLLRGDPRACRPSSTSPVRTTPAAPSPTTSGWCRRSGPRLRKGFAGTARPSPRRPTAASPCSPRSTPCGASTTGTDSTTTFWRRASPSRSSTSRRCRSRWAGRSACRKT